MVFFSWSRFGLNDKNTKMVFHFILMSIAIKLMINLDTKQKKNQRNYSRTHSKSLFRNGAHIYIFKCIDQYNEHAIIIDDGLEHIRDQQTKQKKNNPNRKH